MLLVTEWAVICIYYWARSKQYHVYGLWNWSGKKDIVPDGEIHYNKGRCTAFCIFFPGMPFGAGLCCLENMRGLRKGESSMSNEQTFLMKPKVDFCFKELMEDAEVRKGFISALLGVKPEEIEHTVLLPTHLRQEHPEDKLGIQLAPFPLWPERSVFYLAKMYTGEIQKGESYGVLQKCIHVGILDFVLFGEDEEFYSCFHLWEDHGHRMYTDKLELHILELPKIAEKEYQETELLNWDVFSMGKRRRSLNWQRKEVFILKKLMRG